jgi:hypothetical protein
MAVEASRILKVTETGESEKTPSYKGNSSKLLKNKVVGNFSGPDFYSGDWHFAGVSTLC